jgi:hypothetical protein
MILRRDGYLTQLVSPEHSREIKQQEADCLSRLYRNEPLGLIPFLSKPRPVFHSLLSFRVHN